MTDITGVPAFGGGGFASRQLPETPKPVVQEVAKPAADGSATNSQGETLRGQNGADYQSKRDSNDADQKRRDAVRDDIVLSGPTPSFQASILEVEKDLRNVIARVEAKRTQQADEAAIAPRASSVAEPEQTDQTPDTDQATTASPLAPTGTDDEPPAQDHAPSAPQAATAPTETVDPEVARSGPAATQETPYDPQT